MNKRKLALTTIITTLLTMLVVTAQGAVVVIPELKAEPANSHLFRVTGADFNVSNAVTLQLFNGSDLAYKFTEDVATNDTGEFTAIVIAPTSLAGEYNLTATTFTTEDAYNVTGTVQITLPDMTGPTGATGENGTQGAQGPQGLQGVAGTQGIQGEAANVDGVLIVAVIAIIVSAMAVVIAYKKR